MIDLIQNQRETLNELCRRYRVKSLDLFGSAAAGPFDPARSDLDFLVEFEPLPIDTYADHYFGLQESLQELFGHPVDLVMTRAIKNRYFLEAIALQREVLYAA